MIQYKLNDFGQAGVSLPNSFIFIVRILTYWLPVIAIYQQIYLTLFFRSWYKQKVRKPKNGLFYPDQIK